MQETDTDDAVASTSSQSKGAVPTAGSSSALSPSSPESSAMSLSAPLPPLQRLHLLPFDKVDEKLGGRSRIDSIAPALRAKRAAKEVLKMGDVISHEDVEFAIIKCEPAEGPLGTDTDFFLDGSSVVCFEKIEFSAWGPTEMSSEELFSQVIAGYFKNEYAPYGSANATRVRLFYCNQVLQIGDIYLQVEATEPSGLGVVTTQTEIYANWDKTPEFEKVHIMPFQDTLPRAYQFDIFHDYIQPFLHRNIHKKFQCNDLFMYHGVQFKMVACEPNVAARIGKDTTIYCEGMLHPSLRNLLPPDLLNQVAQLPPGLQMLLLNTERTTRELEDMLTQRRGLFEETLGQVERLTWPPNVSRTPNQTTCMICLEEFAIGDDCRQLPCRHVFHGGCIDEWLRRCTDCPVCKANVDRAIRHY